MLQACGVYTMLSLCNVYVWPTLVSASLHSVCLCAFVAVAQQQLEGLDSYEMPV